MKKILGSLMVLLFVTGVCVELSAQSTVFLGQATAGFRAERDTIHVGRQAGFFRGIRFNVTGNDILMRTITITFVNGQSQMINVNHRFLPNSGSRYIDLPGNRRMIRSVSFVYKSLGSARHERNAVVKLYGVK